MKKTPKVTDCYKLPWTEFDNPNGWIEPLYTCNIVCPGCYRGADIKKTGSSFLSLDEVKKQIDWFKKHRNVHTISIAGGEPTLYPHLREMIAYASQQKLRTMLFTNGLLLTREFAEELAQVGLTQVAIHVDRFQKRPDMKQLTSIELRQKFVDTLRDIPNLQIGFIQPISKDCAEEVAQLSEFLKKNFSIVNLMIFTVYRNICETSESKPELDDSLSVTGLMQMLQKHSSMIPAAYLGSLSNSADPTWLFSQRMGVDGKTLGDVSSDLYKFAHKRYRMKHKRHLFISRNNTIKISSLFQMIFRVSVLKIAFKYLIHGLRTRNWNKGNINFQTFLLLRGPEKQHGKWDLCEGCPDRMIYNGKIIPSCILENIKEQQMEEFKPVTL